jgi:hypothetical protein
MSTLQGSLEEVGRLGPTYSSMKRAMNGQLQRCSSGCASSSRRSEGCQCICSAPGSGITGAIYETNRTGEVLSAVPLYWIERRLPLGPAPWTAAGLMMTKAGGEVVPLEEHTAEHEDDTKSGGMLVGQDSCKAVSTLVSSFSFPSSLLSRP